MNIIRIKKTAAVLLFIFAIGCIFYATCGSMAAVALGTFAIALACSIAEDIDKQAKEGRL